MHAQSQHNQSIKAVIWDLGGVLVRTVDQSGRWAWEKRLGLEQGALHNLIFHNPISLNASRGQAEPDEIWAWVAGQLKLDTAEMTALKEDFWHGDEVDTALVDYIRALRPVYKTGLLSNAWSNLRMLVEEEWEMADAFDEIIISAEVGVIKPNPRIYRMALRALQVEPGEAVFIDDFAENIDGALALGMHAVHFSHPETARQELEELLSGAS